MQLLYYFVLKFVLFFFEPFEILKKTSQAGVEFFMTTDCQFSVKRLLQK